MKRIVGMVVAIMAVGVAAPAHAESCATGGSCRLGDLGPGGGRVVVVSTTPQWWGTYIEARPVLTKRGMPWSLLPTASLYSSSSTIRLRIDAMSIGMGGTNTNAIINQSGPGIYAAWIAHTSALGNKSDWVLPSRDELDAVFHLMNSGY